MAVPLASAVKVVTFGGFKRRATSFRMAGMAPRGILSCFINASQVVLCNRRATVASFSEDDLHVSWEAQLFGRHFAWQARHFRRVVSRVLRIALSALRQV